MKCSVRSRVLGVLSSVLGISSVVGCGGREEEKLPVQEGYDGSLCDAGDQVNYVTDLNPTSQVDYVALLHSWDGDPTFNSIQASGTCGSVCDEVDALDLSDPGISDGWDGSYYLVTTSGTDVQLAMTLAEVKTFLGTIDTPSEAALLALLSGYSITCDRKNLSETEEGYEIYVETGTTCGGDITGHRLLVKPDGTMEDLESAIVEEGDDGCVIGRIPTGLLAEKGDVSCGEDLEITVGKYFARVAQLEAASVLAFEELARELRHHGAPESLVERARRAAREETRHAILTRSLARRYGEERPAPRVERSGAPRSLFAMAIDNAIEGLTRETFGALLGQVQARTAADPAVRRVMEIIAEDETGHAEFSEELHDWLVERLSDRERRQVEAVRNAAVSRFRASVHRDYSAEVQRLAGLPSLGESRALFDGMFPATA